MKIFGILSLVIFGMMALSGIGVAFDLITIPWLTFGSKVQMNRDIVTKTYGADNALQQYHWFKERAGAIDATKKKVENAQEALNMFRVSAGDRKGWTFEDKSEDARLNAVLQGTKNHLEELKAEYNARASETDRAVFKDELPLFFDL